MIQTDCRRGGHHRIRYESKLSINVKNSFQCDGSVVLNSNIAADREFEKLRQVGATSRTRCVHQRQSRLLPIKQCRTKASSGPVASREPCTHSSASLLAHETAQYNQQEANLQRVREATAGGWLRQVAGLGLTAHETHYTFLQALLCCLAPR